MRKLENKAVSGRDLAMGKMLTSPRRFTPCAARDSLLEATIITANNAAPGDVSLFSPACSSFDLTQNDQHRGEVFPFPMDPLAKSATHLNLTRKKFATTQPFKFTTGFFEEKPRRKTTTTKHHLIIMKGRSTAPSLNE